MLQLPGFGSRTQQPFLVNKKGTHGEGEVSPGPALSLPHAIISTFPALSIAYKYTTVYYFCEAFNICLLCGIPSTRRSLSCCARGTVYHEESTGGKGAPCHTHPDLSVAFSPTTSLAPNEFPAHDSVQTDYIYRGSCDTQESPRSMR